MDWMGPEKAGGGVAQWVVRWKEGMRGTTWEMTLTPKLCLCTWEEQEAVQSSVLVSMVVEGSMEDSFGKKTVLLHSG